MQAKRANLTAAELIAKIVNQIGSLEHASTAELRSLRRKFSRELANEPGSSLIEAALLLLKHGGPFRFIAYELVQSHKEARNQLNRRVLERLAADLDSWGAVDTFACYLSGPAWRTGQINDRTVQKWARSKDRWWRRAAVVTTVPLNNRARGGSGDVDRTLMVCRIVIADRDQMVVKAVSWALRELAKRKPDAVAGFVDNYRQKLATRVIREVNNKLRTGLKNPKQLRG